MRQRCSFSGIGLFILLPILRVIIMLTIFLQKRDYKFAVAAAVVLAMIIAGFAVGILSKRLKKASRVREDLLSS